MSPLEKVLWWAMGVAGVAVVLGVCSQGRLKHWILVLLGGVPREAKLGPFGEIPRGERDWSILTRLVDFEGSSDVDTENNGARAQNSGTTNADASGT